MVGKDPHRIEGKKGADEWHRRMRDRIDTPDNFEAARDAGDAPDPSQYAAEEQIAGSRPGVESRVKDAISRREERSGE